MFKCIGDEKYGWLRLNGVYVCTYRMTNGML